MALLSLALHLLGFVSVRRSACLPQQYPASCRRRCATGPLLALAPRKAKIGDAGGPGDRKGGDWVDQPPLDPASRRNDESQMVWYLQKIYDPQNKGLLNAEEEISLSRSVQRLLALEEQQEELRVHLGRPPSNAELALHAGLPNDEFLRLRSEGQAAWERLLVSNQRLVVSVAKRYMGKGLLLEDMIQEGNLGLIRATQLFDPERKLRFSTYATWWIRQAITRSLAEKTRTIRVPVYMHEFLMRIRRSRAMLSAELGRRPTEEEVAEVLQVKVSRVKMAQVLPTTISIDAPSRADSSTLSAKKERSLADLIAAPQLETDLIDATLLRSELEAILSSALPPLERDVLRLRFGLDDGVSKTAVSVGEIAGLKPVKVRNLEQMALRKLRSREYTRRLEGFLENERPRKAAAAKEPDPYVKALQKARACDWQQLPTQAY